MPDPLPRPSAVTQAAEPRGQTHRSSTAASARGSTCGCSARATNAAGSGLGLSVVAAIVAAHGGTVEVTSEPDQGSCFGVRLAAADAHA